MGALARLPQWIPEDDLLLKSAVEAGASLESLAKGAVRFSRRFTIQELQDRWHSLLYDADISAEASTRMVEIEIEFSVSNNSKPNKFCSSKVKEWKPGKRKSDSVYCHYYTMRRKIWKDPCRSANRGFLVPPGKHVYIGGDNGCREELRSCNEKLVGNCVLGETTSGQFENPEAVFSIGQDVFPEMLKEDSVAANADVAAHNFHEEAYVNSVDVDIPDGIVSRDDLYGFSENAPSLAVDKEVADNADQSLENNSDHNDSSQILRENLTAFQNCSGVQEFESPQTLPVSNSYETNNFRKKLLSSFPSVNDNHNPPCSGFGENQHLSLDVAGCSGSFHHIGYSSPQAAMPIWRMIDENSTGDMPIGGNFEGNDQGVSQAVVLENSKKISSVGNVHILEPKLQDGIHAATLTDSRTTVEGEGDFMDFSLTFPTDDDLFLIDGDGKDILDASCLDGLNVIFSDSPGDTHQDNVVGSSDAKAVVILDADNMVTDGACVRDSKDLGAQLHSGYNDMPNVSGLVQNVDMSSDVCSSVPLEGFMHCTLNTEDPEIPCNDHSLLTTHVPPLVASSDLKHSSEVSGLVSSGNIVSDNREPIARRLLVRNEDQKAPVQSLASSLKIGPKVVPKVGLLHLNDEVRIKAELPKGDTLTKSSRHAGITADEMNHTSAPVALLSAHIVRVKQETISLGSRKCGEFYNSVDSLLEESIQGSDHAKIYSLNITDDCKQEADKRVNLQKCISSNSELGFGENGFLDNLRIGSTSDQEEQLSDCDNEVPYFSDIEAMILDMDLDPSDQESSFFSREVSRYQYLDTKKAIIRLEQGAHSYMQRAIASHGAFAILYGNHLKHYIMKPEVSLGRATEDVNVDIDLGREGPANKISRRQAIIKMDEDGSFLIKNTGKCPVLVNGKDVLVGQQFNLSSGSLIEIRNMKFIFDVNQHSVRQYLLNVGRKSSQEQNSRFNWVGVP